MSEKDNTLAEEIEAEELLPEEGEASEAATTEPEEEREPELRDYALIEAEDVAELRSVFPELSEIESISELSGAERYATLRDLGLTPKEAYLATREVRPRRDSRRHLSSAVPRGAGAPGGGIPRSELEGARGLFPGLGDREIAALYRKVMA